MAMKQAFAEKYGPWALVTGAASGLGKEFTNQLAAQKLHIIAVDVQGDLLNEQVALLQEKYGVQAVAVVIDLSQADFLPALLAGVEDREVGLLANVAGISSVGEFLDIPLAQLQKQINVNCLAPMTLGHHFGQQMRQRGRGGIIFLSSASAYQGTALVAHYAATKAFNLILAEGLWDELRSSGVDVLGFAPGATNTPGFHKDRPRYQAVSMPYMEAAPTVAEAIAALGRTPSRVAGGGNRAAALLTGRLLPRKSAIKLFGDSMRKIYAHSLQAGQASNGS
jgi:short-subunit dehydrogenase